MVSVGTEKNLSHNLKVDIFRMEDYPHGYADFKFTIKGDRELFEEIKWLCIGYHLLNSPDSYCEYGDKDNRTFEVKFNSQVDFYYHVLNLKVEELLLKNCESEAQDCR